MGCDRTAPGEYVERIVRVGELIGDCEVWH
jgi:hypothetical protein